MIRKRMEVGDRIILLEEMNNGLITIKQFAFGQIIYLQNQIEATIWFRGFGQFHSESITNALDLDTSFYKNGKMDGITVSLKRDSFAIKHNYTNEEFRKMVVEEDKALTIPFVAMDEVHRKPSNMSRNVNGVFETVYQYDLERLIDVVSDSFQDWTEKNTKTRKIRKSEKENGDFPEDWDRCLTDESNNKFYNKKQEIELAFARATGVFYEFTGGLMFN
jgi:hypothetical protein